jgi:N-methylhydantoinase A
MGGTTAKACLIDDGQPLLSPEFEVNRVYRFKKGSGLPIRVPVIELIEIGAGGGSIARVDALGLLKVGPDSAGADPGPACYGRGGTQPTVTDADLLLGYLDAEFFLGGAMSLDVAAARDAVRRLADQIGTSAIEAAWGIHEVVNEQMASAARMHAVEQGKDPRAYPMFAFGGAGPVHAYSVARILGCREVIVPRGAGVGSTIGFLVAPVAFDFVRSYVGRLAELDWSEVNRRFAEMEAEGRAILGEAGVAPEAITMERTAELRYVGQGHEVRVSLPERLLSEALVPEIEQRFAAEYRRLYGRTAEGNPLEAMTWRLVASAPATPSTEASVPGGAPIGGVTEPRAMRHREIYLAATRRFAEVPVYRREELRPGMRFSGPAVIEERESTIVAAGPCRITIDAVGNVVLTLP